MTWIVLIGLGTIALLSVMLYVMHYWEQTEIARLLEERQRLDRIVQANHPPKAPGLHSRRIS